MGTVNSFKTKEVKKIFKKHYWCRFHNQWKWSHENWYFPAKDQLFTLAFHSSTEIARGTLQSTLKDLGIDENEFIKFSGKQR